MLSIEINKLGKKYGSEWIFRNLDFSISAQEKLVILGGNGSGKSTLLQIISGFILPGEGNIRYSLDKSGSKTEIPQEKLMKYVSFASPYLQLVEDFTLTETVKHCGEFKPFIQHLSENEIIEILQLSHAKNKFIKQFSSGMKQRLKLGLAILSDTPLLLLDEPSSNLDKAGIAWYEMMISKYGTDRTVIVCSNNIDHEYFFCHKHLNVSDFKSAKALK